MPAWDPEQQSVPSVPIAFFPASFQQRVERFHENPGIRELPSDTTCRTLEAWYLADLGETHDCADCGVHPVEENIDGLELEK